MNLEQTEQLARLWTASQAEVAAFVGTLVPDRDQAADLMQQVAVQIVRNYGKYDDSRPFVAWAIGVAKNEALAQRRRHATDRHLFNDELVGRIAATYEQILIEEPEPAERALETCLDQLEGRGKRALILYYQKGLKAPGIAEKLEMSAGAVRTLLTRTRAAVRRCIEHQLALRGKT